MTVEQAKGTVKDFILKEFLPGENPDNLTDSTPLISAGVLDSLAVLRLVAHLEETFAIQLAAHEVNVDNLNTVADIANFVLSKC
jgi:acyl carrier protein